MSKFTPWAPPPSELSYYSIPSPSSQQYSLPQLLPFQLSLSPNSDPTFGRAALPYSPAEESIRKEYKYKDGKVYPEKGKEGEKWIAYQVWEPKEGMDKGADLLFVHGINDYGGKHSEHARIWLEAGYRVIVPDLPGHGRSTGIHVYLPDMDLMADAVYAVLHDVVSSDAHAASTSPSSATEDKKLQQQRKIFVAGQSLGGFTAALTCLKYGAERDTSLKVEEDFRPVITGGLFLCPMLAISAQSRPHWSVELVARGIASIAGTLPLAAANKGKNSEDPYVEQQFEMDPQTYHGKLRVGTGLAILKGITELDKLMGNLKVPFSLHHGTGDRVTSYHGSEKLYKEAGSTDKKLTLYDGYEHILLRKGRDAEDDQRRQKVMGDMLKWMQERS